MGWASGLQAGMRLGESIRQGQIERDLADEAKKHQVGLVSPDQAALDELIARRDAELQGLGEGATPAQVQGIHAQYTPQIASMAQPQYTYGGQTFTDKQAAETAATQGRTQGLANVYRSLGNEEQASVLEARALQNRAAGLTVDKQQREADQTRLFDTGLKDINNQEFEKPEDRTAAILTLVEKTRGPEARMTLESQYTRSQLDKITMKAAEFEQGFKQAFTKGVDATMSWLDEQDPGFTLKRVGNQIIQTNLDGSKRIFAQGSEGQIMEQFAGHASPSNFLTLSKNIADRQAHAAHTAMLKDIYGAKTLEGRIKETEIQLGRKLTEDEVLSMSGVTAKGKAGGILTRAVEQKKNDDGTYTAFDKGTGRALYNTYNGEEIPLGMTIDEYAGMKKAARDNKVGLQIGENANGQLALKFIGADGKPYDDVEAARYAKPAKPEASGDKPEPALTKTNSRTGTGERNPFVDANGRPLPNAPEGAPAVGPALVKKGAAAVENAVGSRASSTRYLEGKIARKETLTPAEKARAKQLGLKTE